MNTIYLSIHLSSSIYPSTVSIDRSIYTYTWLCCSCFTRSIIHGRWATKNAHHEGTTGTSTTLCPLAQSGCLFVEVLSVPHMRTYLEGNNVLVALMHTVRATSIPKELRRAAKAELISELIFANA